MKQLFSITLLLSLTFLLTASSCKKQNAGPQLPSETQTGANTLGFKIDGKVYSASGKSGLLSNQYVYGGGPFSDSAIIIRAHNREQKFDLYITIKYSGIFGIHLTTEYPYTASLQLNSDGTIPTGKNTYNTTKVYVGKINIKFTDAILTPRRGFTVVAGTFEMEAINSEGKIIQLKNGRFDIGQ